MNSLFKFNYFGLHSFFKSNDSLFIDLAKNKFKSYTKGVTHEFESRKIILDFKVVKMLPKHSILKTISNNTFISKDRLFIKHNYLTTDSLIATKFKDNDILSIKIFFKSTLIFNLANLLTRNLLKRQLFQNIIKLYIEQSLLWNLVTKFKLNCLHASAIEKNNKVIVFAGLNGIGKSTLALYLTQKQGFSLFCDNYLLVEKNKAYFSPDVVRLTKKSLNWLNIKPSSLFGFNKFNLESSDIKISKQKISKIKSVYLTTRGDRWSKRKTLQKSIINKIKSFQISNQEEVLFAPVSQYTSENSINNAPMPNCNYFQLNLGKLTDLNYEF
jgi:hypothetical protein